MIEDSLLAFSFPAVGRKKITAAFDGGRITSDAGVMLLGQAERRLGLADKLAAVIADPRNPLLITHSLDSILRCSCPTQGSTPKAVSLFHEIHTQNGESRGDRQAAGRKVVKPDHNIIELFISRRGGLRGG